MNTYSKKEACRMLCRYHNLNGAEALSGKSGVETIMRRIHSIQYDPLHVVARNADLVLQARVRDYAESDLYALLYRDRRLVDGFDKEMCIYDSTDFSQSVGFIWDRSGGAWQGHFVSDNKLRSSILQTLAEKKKIEKIKIEGIEEPFYISKDSFEHMKPQATGSYLRFLAPLDNLMWDRQMLETLFDFNYRWEVYTPVAKRKFGYYVLPVLYYGQFIARFEAEPVKQAKKFVIKNWWWEPQIKPDAAMKREIEQEMTRFAEFLQVENSPGNKDLLSTKGETTV